VTGFQASLLDVGDHVSLGPLRGHVERRTLTDGAWVDLRRGWVDGADALFERLQQTVPWHAERRPMYDRVVDVPRLLSFFDEGDPLPDPALERAKQALEGHYRDEPFATAGLCLYRDGRDSVAWHGDRIGRGSTEDTMVAIVVLGAPRPFLLRPRERGTSRIRLDLGHGDLVVMGGSCQRTWEHAVPKTSRAVGPRISVQFRPRGVR
jgi:alkylated DNA repair dioxygenase AlkB